MIGKGKPVLARMRPILAIWFFVGMPLTMLLSILYSFFGIPQPPLLFFLTSVTYFSGSILGGTWSGGQLWKSTNSRIVFLGLLCVLIASGGFLCLGIVFVFIAFKRL